jgi:peptidoglycan/LPS O-acetylase OafA/YrhL
MKSPRFNEIDLLRAVACFAVVAFHFFSRGPLVGELSGLDFSTIDMVARYGYLGVHLFFIISGFVILMSTQNVSARNFLSSRAARLYPTLWAGATLTAVTAWLMPGERFDVSLTQYFANLTMVPTWIGSEYLDGSYWSLAFEVNFYLMMFLAMRLNLTRHIVPLFGAWLVVSLVNAIRPMYPVQVVFAANWAPLFVAGGLFYLARTQSWSLPRVALLVASFALAQYYGYEEAMKLNSRAGNSPVSPFVVAASITSFYAIFFLISLGRLSMPSFHAVHIAGLLTYPIYVIHQNFGFMVYELMVGYVPPMVALVLMLTIVGAAACAILKCVERPLGRNLRVRLMAA